MIEDIHLLVAELTAGYRLDDDEGAEGSLGIMARCDVEVRGLP